MLPRQPQAPPTAMQPLPDLREKSKCNSKPLKRPFTHAKVDTQGLSPKLWHITAYEKKKVHEKVPILKVKEIISRLI